MLLAGGPGAAALAAPRGRRALRDAAGPGPGPAPAPAPSPGGAWGKSTADDAGTCVLTSRGNFDRSGFTENSVFTPANVGGGNFGKLFDLAVDGAVFAQPLYVGQMPFPDGSRRPVTWLADMHNSAFAYDLSDAAAPSQMWNTSLGASVPKGWFLPAPQYGTNYHDIQLEVGILPTPVIDPYDLRTMYLVAQTPLDGGANLTQHVLFALDTITGEPLRSRVVEGYVAGSGAGSVDGTLTFNSTQQLCRPGMALHGDSVAFACGSHANGVPSHGWFFTYDKATLTRTGVWSSSPDCDQGTIWMAGSGIPVTDGGDFLAVTGNGVGCNATQVGQLSETLVRLRQDAAAAGGIRLVDRFTPSQWQAWDDQDLDFGASGIVRIPGTGLITAGGKSGDLMLLNETALGGGPVTGNPSVLSDVQGTLPFPGMSDHIHGSPAVYRNRIMVMGEQNPIRAFDLTANDQLVGPVAQSLTRTIDNSMPGGFLSVSANGDDVNSAVVWVDRVVRGDANPQDEPGMLEAYDFRNLTLPIYSTETNWQQDGNFLFAKFTYPTVADGRVLVATHSNYVRALGLRA